jgi:hypothetical protein
VRFAMLWPSAQGPDKHSCHALTSHCNPHALPQNRTSDLHQWNFKLVRILPWLNMNRNKPPMLTVLSDRGTIFEGKGGGLACRAFTCS